MQRFTSSGFRDGSAGEKGSGCGVIIGADDKRTAMQAEPTKCELMIRTLNILFCGRFLNNVNV